MVFKKAGFEVVIVNNNPKTVSTDSDTADRLYFEPLTNEDVIGIINIEKLSGVVVSFGGHTATKLAKFLRKQGVHLISTSTESISIVGDCEHFN